MDSALSFDQVLAAKKEVRAKLKKQLWVLRRHGLSARAKLQVWHSLHRARWSYAAELLACESTKLRRWLKQSWYQALQTLLGITARVERE